MTFKTLLAAAAMAAIGTGALACPEGTPSKYDLKNDAEAAGVTIEVLDAAAMAKTGAPANLVSGIMGTEYKGMPLDVIHIVGFDGEGCAAGATDIPRKFLMQMLGIDTLNTEN